MHFKLILSFIVFGLHLVNTWASPLATRDEHETKHIDYNAMFDGSLGNLPAMWLVSQGALAGFKTANSTHILRRQEDQARTDLENGAVMAAFISQMLLLPVKIHDKNAVQGMCQALFAGATAMGAAVVGQESGEEVFNGNSTSDDDLAQGALPAGFIGGSFTAVIGTTLSKTICDRFESKSSKPELPTRPGLDALEDLVQLPGRILGDAACLAISNLASELGIDLARGLHFGQQLREILQVTEQIGLVDTVRHATTEMTRQVQSLSSLAKTPQNLAPAKAALAALAALAAESTLLLGIENSATPTQIPENTALESIETITSHMGATLDFTATLPETAALATNLRPGMESLARAVRLQVRLILESRPETIEVISDDQPPNREPERPEQEPEEPPPGYEEEPPPDYEEESSKPDDDNDDDDGCSSICIFFICTPCW